MRFFILKNNEYAKENISLLYYNYYLTRVATGKSKIVILSFMMCEKEISTVRSKENGSQVKNKAHKPHDRSHVRTQTLRPAPTRQQL